MTFSFCESLRALIHGLKYTDHSCLPFNNPTQCTLITGASPVGCYYQQYASSTTSSKVLSSFQRTYTSGANLGCSVLCNNQNFNFYGLVNTGTGTNVDCYCGDTLNYVTILSLGSGAAPNNNCGLCPGGPAPSGECGILSSNTVAIFARAF